MTEKEKNVMQMIAMGPIGQSSRGSGCFEWAETLHNVISHINVSFNKHGVTSIQFGYVEDGSVVMSETYGSSSSDCSRRIVSLISFLQTLHCIQCLMFILVTRKSAVEAES